MKDLATLCRESGGGFEQCQLSTPSRATIRLTQAAWERYRKVLLTPAEMTEDPPGVTDLRIEIQQFRSGLVSEDGEGRVWEGVVSPESKDPHAFHTSEKPETWFRIRFRVRNSTTDLVLKKELIEPESWEGIVEAVRKRIETGNMTVRYGESKIAETVDKDLPEETRENTADQPMQIPAQVAR